MHVTPLRLTTSGLVVVMVIVVVVFGSCRSLGLALELFPFVYFFHRRPWE